MVTSVYLITITIVLALNFFLVRWSGWCPVFPTIKRLSGSGEYFTRISRYLRLFTVWTWFFCKTHNFILIFLSALLLLLFLGILMVKRIFRRLLVRLDCRFLISVRFKDVVFGDGLGIVVGDTKTLLLFCLKCSLNLVYTRFGFTSTCLYLSALVILYFYPRSADSTSTDSVY